MSEDRLEAIRRALAETDAAGYYEDVAWLVAEVDKLRGMLAQVQTRAPELVLDIETGVVALPVEGAG
jgi:hypothetical protein